MPLSDGPIQTPKALAAAAFIAAAALLVYWPSLRGPFILDDGWYLTDSPLISSPNGLYGFWFTTEPMDYYPVSNTTLWLEWRLWEMNPIGYRVTNLVLHIATALLLWSILRKLSIPGAFLAALIYAVHPVNAAAVPIVSQRKEMLAAFFFLCSILWYLLNENQRRARAEQMGRRRAVFDTGPWYWLSLLGFVLAILSKASVATLPLVLLLIDWWLHGRVTKRSLLQALPFFCIALVTPVHHWFHVHSGQTYYTNFADRLAGAGAVPWFYLSKALLPINLFAYPQWSIRISDPLWWLPMLAIMSLTAALFWQRNSPQAGWSRALLFAWCFFGVTLVPVLGIVSVGSMRFSLVADQFQHLAIIGVISLVAAGCAYYYRRASRPQWAPILATVLVGFLAALTWQLSALMADPIQLFQYSLEKTPQSWVAHTNLGIALAKTGRGQEALNHFEQALRLRPESAAGYCNLGIELANAGQPEKAIEYLQHALQIKPDYREARDGLCTAYMNLGNASLSLGKLEQAFEYYQQALQYNPDQAQAHHNLGLVLGQAGKTQAALVEFEQALRLKPDYAEVHNDLGNVLLSVGRTAEAIEHYEQALRLKPDYAPAQLNLANTLFNSGRLDEAIEHYWQVVRLEPEDAAAFVKLADAYAALHRSVEALATAQQALDLARARGQTAQAEQIEQWIAKYRESLAEKK